MGRPQASPTECSRRALDLPGEFAVRRRSAEQRPLQDGGVSFLFVPFSSFVLSPFGVCVCVCAPPVPKGIFGVPSLLESDVTSSDQT